MAEILILGGTREAATLARSLVREGHSVTTSLAGRTKEPLPLAGKTRTGGFGGPQGLADYLHHNKINRLIDATHPFATQISANAREAARLTGIKLEQHTRPPWQCQPDDLWTAVPDIQAAIGAIPPHARVLLALGVQHIGPFAARADVHFIIRMVDAPAKPLPFAQHTILTGRPSLNAQDEAALLRDHAISHIVCRNSGGKGAYAKIEAARNLKVPVIIINRPAPASSFRDSSKRG